MSGSRWFTAPIWGEEECVLCVEARGRLVLGTRRPEAESASCPVPFSCAEEAISFVTRLTEDELSAGSLRRFLEASDPGALVARLTRAEVVRLVAIRLVGGRYFLRWDDSQPRQAAGWVEAENGADAPAAGEDTPGAQEGPRTTWFAAIVVDHESGTPLAGVKLTICTTAGEKVKMSTPANGRVRLDGLDPGTCDLACELMGARRPHTANVQSVGRNSAGASGAEPTGRSSTALKASRYWLANVKVHRVSSGDSLEDIAKQASMTWQELARFNWGTDDPDQVNLRLRDAVGCTHTAADGNNYVFHDDDDPGLVYVPSVWTKQGLPTGQTHVVRARLPAWEVQVERGNGMQPADTLSLTAVHGGYEERIKVSEAARRGEYLLFRFSVDGGGRYDIGLNLGQDSYYLWRGLVLPREGSGEDSTGVSWGDDDDEPDIYDGAPPATGDAVILEGLEG